MKLSANTPPWWSSFTPSDRPSGCRGCSVIPVRPPRLADFDTLRVDVADADAGEEAERPASGSARRRIVSGCTPNSAAILFCVSRQWAILPRDARVRDSKSGGSTGGAGKAAVVRNDEVVPRPIPVHFAAGRAAGDDPGAALPDFLQTIKHEFHGSGGWLGVLRVAAACGCAETQAAWPMPGVQALGTAGEPPGLAAAPACRLRGSEFFTASFPVPLRPAAFFTPATEGCKQTWARFFKVTHKLQFHATSYHHGALGGVASCAVDVAP